MKNLDPYDLAVIRYCAGAIISTLLTVGVYFVVVGDFEASSRVLAGIVLAAAAMQFVTQIVLFLPIMSKRGPSWRLHSLWFSALMIIVVVVGSLWVMRNLDYNMGMSPEQMHEYMLEEGQKGF